MSWPGKQLMESYARIQDLLWLGDVRQAHLMLEKASKSESALRYREISDKGADLLKSIRREARKVNRDRAWIANRFALAIQKYDLTPKDVVLGALASRIAYLGSMFSRLIELIDVGELPRIWSKGKLRYSFSQEYDKIEVRALLEGDLDRPHTYELPDKLSEAGFVLGEPKKGGQSLSIRLFSSKAFAEILAQNNKVRLEILSKARLSTEEFKELVEDMLDGIG